MKHCVFDARVGVLSYFSTVREMQVLSSSYS